MITEIEEYKKEMIEAFKDLDETRIRAFCSKHDTPASDNLVVFWGTIYKAITGSIGFSMPLRIKAKRWLIDHNMDSWDDGDVPG